MPKETTISIAEFFDELSEIDEGDIDKDAALQEWLHDNEKLIERALELDVSYVDPRAQETGWSIGDISVVGDNVQVDYVVDYEIYFGCDSINKKGEVDRSSASSKAISSTLLPKSCPSRAIQTKNFNQP